MGVGQRFQQRRHDGVSGPLQIFDGSQLDGRRRVAQLLDHGFQPRRIAGRLISGFFDRLGELFALRLHLRVPGQTQEEPGAVLSLDGLQLIAIRLSGHQLGQIELGLVGTADVKQRLDGKHEILGRGWIQIANRQHDRMLFVRRHRAGRLFAGRLRSGRFRAAKGIRRRSGCRGPRGSWAGFAAPAGAPPPNGSAAVLRRQLHCAGQQDDDRHRKDLGRLHLHRGSPSLNPNLTRQLATCRATSCGAVEP